MLVGGRVLHWLPNTDLRNSHDGLQELAKKELGIRVSELRVGDCIMFINTSWTAFKILVPSELGPVVLHFKHPKGHKLNAQAVIRVPKFMRGNRINYDRALTEAVVQARYPHKTLDQIYQLEPHLPH